MARKVITLVERNGNKNFTSHGRRGSFGETSLMESAAKLTTIPIKTLLHFIFQKSSDPVNISKCCNFRTTALYKFMLLGIYMQRKP